MPLAPSDFWSPALTDTDSHLGLKRLSPEQADEILRAAETGNLSPVGRMERMIGLARVLGRTIELNAANEDDESARLDHIARELVSALGEEARRDGHSPALQSAALAELRELKRYSSAAGSTFSVPKNPFQSERPAAEMSLLESYARGIWRAADGDIEGALSDLEQALHHSVDHPAARTLIALARLALLYESGRFNLCKSESSDLIGRLSMSATQHYELGMANHWLAKVHDRDAHWEACVDAARESNLQLFRFGASQRCPLIGDNYYLVAKGMAELREYGEAVALAQLSLRSLKFGNREPSRGDALLILARCLRAFDDEKPKADARGILTRLLESRPDVASPEGFYADVEGELKALGPGPVSPRPG